MPLYEITLNQQYFGQLTVNRWNYNMTGTPAAVTGSFALLTVLGLLPVSTTLPNNTLGGELQQLQNAGVRFVSALARAVYIDDDFYDSPFLSNTIGLGEATTAGLSPTTAFGFRSNRVKQSIHRGYKRFVGVSEGNLSSGGDFTGGAAAQMDIVAAQMATALAYTDDGNSLTFTPCIVSKESYVVPDSGKTAYKYWKPESVQLEHTAIGIAWEAYQYSRTQTSRQYGRGQ